MSIPKGVSTRTALCLYLVCIAHSMPSIGQLDRTSYAESGTQIAVAITSKYAIVVADSQVTHSGDDGIPFSTEPSRKLIQVGSAGACGIDGYLGKAAADPVYDLATNIRAWVSAYPAVEAYDGIDAILGVAANTWNRRHFRSVNSLPSRRKVGDEIASIWCGSIKDGRPVITGGRLIVGEQLVALPYRLEAPRLPLMLDGLIKNDELMAFLAEKEIPTSLFQVYRGLVDASRMDSNADGYLRILRSTAIGSGNLAAEPPSIIDTQAFLKKAFFVAEIFAPEVISPPNNVIIISSTFRTRTILEAADWPR